MRYTGVGDVYRNGQRIARVFYELTTAHANIDSGAAAGPDAGVGGVSNTKGFVVVEDGHIEVGEKVTLHMQSGGEIEILATENSRDIRGYFKVVGYRGRSPSSIRAITYARYAESR